MIRRTGVSRTGITGRNRGIIKPKQKLVKQKKEDDLEEEKEIVKTNSHKLADKFKDISLGSGINAKNEASKVASEVLPTTKKLNKFIKFNI